MSDDALRASATSSSGGTDKMECIVKSETHDLIDGRHVNFCEPPPEDTCISIYCLSRPADVGRGGKHRLSVTEYTAFHSACHDLPNTSRYISGFDALFRFVTHS